jgi:hypothetical protein
MKSSGFSSSADFNYEICPATLIDHANPSQIGYLYGSLTSATVLLLGQLESGSKSGKLVFQRFGNRYFLNQIWGHEASMGLRFRAPGAEIKLEIASEPSPSQSKWESPSNNAQKPGDQSTQ